MPANAGDVGSIPDVERSPGEESGNPLQYSCLGDPMDTRSLMGYSLWGCKRVGQLVTKQQQSSKNGVTEQTCYRRLSVGSITTLSGFLG